MKKGIEVWSDYDLGGDWCLHIQKKKGRLTLDEIRQTAKAYDEDHYILILDCTDVEDERGEGDAVTLYKADLLMKL